jgi:CBS domain containing-hemolysin-like protein
MISYIVLIFLALFLEGFFSGSETALVSSNFMRLIHLKKDGKKQAMVAYELLKRPDRLLVTTLVGTNLSVVISSSLATFFFVKIFQDRGSLIATLVMTPLVLVVGEIIPKVLGRQHANRIVMLSAFPLNFCQKIFSPVIEFVSYISRFIINISRMKGPQKNPFITKEEIKLLIAEIAKEGVLEEQEEEAIQKIFEFTFTKTGDIMTPSNKVISVDFSEGVEQIKEKAKNQGFTRLPVFRDKQIKGLINIFDIFYNKEERNWREFIRPIKEVDVDLRIDKLFSLMKADKESMAAVLKDNKFVGIVTIEDIMEEVICEICE